MSKYILGFNSSSVNVVLSLRAFLNIFKYSSCSSVVSPLSENPAAMGCPPNLEKQSEHLDISSNIL